MRGKSCDHVRYYDTVYTRTYYIIMLNGLHDTVSTSKYSYSYSYAYDIIICISFVLFHFTRRIIPLPISSSRTKYIMIQNESKRNRTKRSRQQHHYGSDEESKRSVEARIGMYGSINHQPSKRSLQCIFESINANYATRIAKERKKGTTNQPAHELLIINYL